MNVYFAGGEDHDHLQIGGVVVTTTSTQFRSTYARCALGSNGVNTTNCWQNSFPYASTPASFWFSARLVCIQNFQNNSIMLKFLDVNGGVRLRISTTSGGTMVVAKLNTAGSATTLTNTGPTWVLTTSGGTIADKLDINWVNAVSGSLDIYYNGVHVFNFVGDTTTEVTQIAYHQLFNLSNTNTGHSWSEIIVSDTDTRSMSLQTLAPVANGNTHNFDTGSPAAANVNETTLSDATLDGSTTPGQIDEYTIPALATGTFSVLAVGISARMQKGTTGPSKMDMVVRVGGTDYLSSDQLLTVTWAAYQNWWFTDPSTVSTPWSALPDNIGLKSVT